MNNKILITSALPYANGPLHFGHIAGAYLPADCYARFQRLSGKDVLYLCGSDEYGFAITISAEQSGKTPQEHVDYYHNLNKSLFQKLQLSFDHYSRTTWKGHQKVVQTFFNELLENGYIEERVTDQLYSEQEGKFLADRYVVGTCPHCGFEAARGDECPGCGASYEAIDLVDPRSKISGSSLTKKPTNHWFLLLEKFRKELETWIESKNWKPNVLKFTKNYVEGLRARAITRDSQWGIPVPLDNAEGKVLYVWFDAPIGYISAAKEWAIQIGQPEKWKEYWCDPKTKLVQFVGKDNIPFHAVIFPAMIMGQNQTYKLVDELPANEFYNLEGKQFSKSQGWYIDLEDFFERYTVDQIRYAIAANAPETSDSEFRWKDFQTRCNVELLGKFGNLVNRTLVFAEKHCASLRPEKEMLQPEDESFLIQMKEITEKIAHSYETFSLRHATQGIMELAQLGNVYFDSKKPWQAAKNKDLAYQMRNTIACCLECLKLLALTSCPIIPEASQKVWKLIGQTTDLVNENWGLVVQTPLKSGVNLPKPEILFHKIEDEQIEKEIKKLQSISSDIKEKKAMPEQIDFKDFQKIDLRVAEIKEAENVPKSKKLLKVKVDLGTEERTIVSGIGERYHPEDLIGKKVVVVVNLKPAKLMGIESQGMLLAGNDERNLEVVFIQSLPIGSRIS
ncbi:MAG: methionine--tRNA ligase [Chlamydiales bacterium]